MDLNKLRFTFFCVDEDPASNMVSEWFEEVAGMEPDEVQHKPKIKLTAANGSNSSGQFVLQIQPGRIDWLFAPVAPSTIDAVAMDMLTQRLQPWVDHHAISLKRIAIGVSLSQVTSSLESAAQLADSMLPDISVTVEDRDFRYRVNRRCESSTIQGLLINRLFELNIVEIRTVRVDGSGQHSSVAEPGVELALDINNVPIGSNEQLPREDVSRLFQEFLEIANNLKTGLRA